MKRRITVGSLTFDIANTIFLLFCGFITMYPFWYIFVYSISNASRAAGAGFLLFPLGFTLDNYISVFTQANILRALFVSVSRTVIGTIGGVFCCSLFAYLLTKELLPFRKFMYRALLVTMYLSPGLIPWFIVMRGLGLQNNFLLYVLPTLISAFNVVLIKTYIESIPGSMEESAFIDGAGYFRVYAQIIFPLSLPVIATVAIFTTVGQWSSWVDNLFLANIPRLQTLQLLLYQYVVGAEAQLANIKNQLRGDVRLVITPTSIRMTITMVATIPILIVYPVMQKYFIKGIMLGAIKG